LFLKEQPKTYCSWHEFSFTKYKLFKLVKKMANPTLSIVTGTGNISAFHNSKQIDKTIDNLNTDKYLLLDLANKLHSTLDVEQIITLFKLEIAPVLNLDTVIYKQPEDFQEIEPKGRHMVSYGLTYMKKNLGEIALIRHVRFNDKEQSFIEKVLMTLLAPLNNALQYQQAVNAAMQDPLTGTFNRYSLDSTLTREIELANRNDTPLSMLALDIDLFKKVNDNYGHAMGDCVLKHITECIKQCTRSCDPLFRYGGEEFVLLLNNTDMDGAEHLAERIRQTIEQTPCVCHGKTIYVTASLGISTLKLEDNQDNFFNRADEALYQAKNSGRNRVVCSTN
jgi:diguanylate cyclase (GGDEF)-like protein